MTRQDVEREPEPEHKHVWEWHYDWNAQPYGLCKCGAVNDDYRSPEITI